MSTTRTSRCADRSRAGYTLVEVLVVTTMLGIAGAMVIPSLGSTGVLRTQAAVRSVVADITFAQMDAIGYQESRAVVFDTDENMYTLTRVGGSTIDPDADALFESKGPEGRYRVDLDAEQFGGAALTDIDLNSGSALIFDELGSPIAAPASTTLSDGGSLRITGQGSTFQINIAAFTGRVTVAQVP